MVVTRGFGGVDRNGLMIANIVRMNRKRKLTQKFNFFTSISMAALVNQFHVDYRWSIVADMQQTSTHILLWTLIVKNQILQFKLYTDPKYC